MRAANGLVQTSSVDFEQEGSAAEPAEQPKRMYRCVKNVDVTGDMEVYGGQQHTKIGEASCTSPLYPPPRPHVAWVVRSYRGVDLQLEVGMDVHVIHVHTTSTGQRRALCDAVAGIHNSAWLNDSKTGDTHHPDTRYSSLAHLPCLLCWQAGSAWCPPGASC